MKLRVKPHVAFWAFSGRHLFQKVFYKHRCKSRFPHVLLSSSETLVDQGPHSVCSFVYRTARVPGLNTARACTRAHTSFKNWEVKGTLFWHYGKKDLVSYF